jgi:hypothetical protein
VSTWVPTLAVAIESAVANVEAKHEFFKRVMRRDTHYGAIPGTDKPTLLKPGAELLLSSFGLCAELSNAQPPILDFMGADHGGEPFILYHRQCAIYRTTQDGERVCVVKADGICNSWETKYRWREAKRLCPECGAAAIIAGKKEYGGGWICWKKRGGCGDSFPQDEPRIASQPMGRVPNEDIADLVNTILKIADKRAYVASTLLATGCSDIFNQDIEDFQSGSAEYAAEPPLAQQTQRTQRASHPAQTPAAALPNGSAPCVSCGRLVPASRARTCVENGQPVTHPNCKAPVDAEFTPMQNEDDRDDAGYGTDLDESEGDS